MTIATFVKADEVLQAKAEVQRVKKAFPLIAAFSNTWKLIHHNAGLLNSSTHVGHVLEIGMLSILIDCPSQPQGIESLKGA